MRKVVRDVVTSPGENTTSRRNDKGFQNGAFAKIISEQTRGPARGGLWETTQLTNYFPTISITEVFSARWKFISLRAQSCSVGGTSLKPAM